MLKIKNGIVISKFHHLSAFFVRACVFILSTNSSAIYFGGDKDDDQYFPIILWLRYGSTESIMLKFWKIFVICKISHLFYKFSAKSEILAW